MLGPGGSPVTRSRSRAVVAALVVAATLVPALAHAAPDDDGTAEAPATSTPPSEPTTTPETTAPETTSATTDSTTSTPTTSTTVIETTTTTTTPATTPTTVPLSTTTEPAPSSTTGPASEPRSASATAAATRQCTVSRTLRRFAKGRDVVCLERELVRRGFSVSWPNQGTYDRTTVAAVRTVQRNRGLLVTGVAGPATLAKLGLWAGPRIDVPCSIERVAVRAGTRGDAARCVEQRLIQLGYDVRGPDRTFDRSGAVAVAAFQRRQGIGIVNGIAAPWTLLRLRIWSGPSLTVACTVSRPVLEGTRGPHARCLEQRLIQLGYPLWAPDRAFGRPATEVLRQYQARIGISADGRAGKYVLAALGIWKQPPRVTCKVGKTVRWGTTGRAALCVERKLVALGYALHGPNRNFDGTSVEAVMAYQRSKGLVADGIAGPFTLYSLGIWSGRNPHLPPPLPANSGTGRRIVYSRAQQRVWAVEADGRVVKTHLISGRLYEPYAGTYSVYSRSMYTYSVADPDVKWRYMVRFAYGPGGGRIGFHEIPTRFGVPLQSESQLGQPLSGGCVRQSTADAIWTWNWAYLGTKVVVL
jgi:peptidoglycan hydrolase-like protein with peptidoglycan-binding domain